MSIRPSGGASTGGTGTSASLADKGTWATTTAYVVGDIVTNSNQRYVANTAHTAGATFAGDAAKWTSLDPGPAASLSNATPLVAAGSGAAGTGGAASRSDHVHPLSSGVPLFIPKSGFYFTGPESVNAGNWNPGLGFQVWQPIIVPSAITVSAIGGLCTIANAGASIRFGIYADDGTMRAGALLLDAGAVAATSTGWVEATGLSLALAAGIYWTSAVQQGSASSSLASQMVTIPIPHPSSVITGNNIKICGYANNGGTTGALPSTAPAPTFYQAAGARVFLKVA